MKRTINGHQALRPAGNHPSPAHWEALKAAKMAQQGNACACCPNDIHSGYQLELHHRHYENWGKEHLEDLVILCSLCHEYITSRYRILDDYKVEAGMLPPPRPGLPEVTIHSEALPKPASIIARPGLPLANCDDTADAKPSSTQGMPSRIRPF